MGWVVLRQLALLPPGKSILAIERGDTQPQPKSEPSWDSRNSFPHSTLGQFSWHSFRRCTEGRNSLHHPPRLIRCGPQLGRRLVMSFGATFEPRLPGLDMDFRSTGPCKCMQINAFPWNLELRRSPVFNWRFWCPVLSLSAYIVTQPH